MIITRLLLLKAAAAAAFGLCLLFFTYAVVQAPRGDNRRLGLRGLKRARALEDSEVWGYFEPIVRWLGVRLSGLLTASSRETLNRQISVAGDFMGLLPEELVAMALVTALLGLGAGYWVGVFTGVGSVAAIGCLMFGMAAPFLLIAASRSDRFKDVNRRLPSAIDVLALGMGAGLDFPASVRQLVEKSASPNDPLIEEFGLVLQSLHLGRTRRQALEELAARVPSESVREFVANVVQAEIRGNPLAEVLKVQAEVSRQRRAIRAEEAAARAGVAMVVPLILVFISIMLLIVAPILMNFHIANL
ncbi:MAG TPA: type II secretion system F family protein [Polyangiaceae bacterium]|nr:type II secretion system F family protein [Polyangiaceae bacterium]